MVFQCFGWFTWYFGCRIWDWGGAFCILDGVSDIAYSELYILEDISHFWVGIWWFGWKFWYFRWWLCDLGWIFGIWTDIFYVLTRVFHMLGNIFDIWGQPCLNFGCCVKVFGDFLVFGMVFVRGPICLEPSKVVHGLADFYFITFCHLSSIF